MDKIVSKIAGFGVPALVFLAAVSMTGLVGAAAITTALAALGPFGMIGGIATLGFIGVVASGITEFGIDEIYSSVIRQLFVNGETKESIISKVMKYPVSKKLKSKLIEDVRKFHLAED